MEVLENEGESGNQKKGANKMRCPHCNGRISNESICPYCKNDLKEYRKEQSHVETTRLIKLNTV